MNTMSRIAFFGIPAHGHTNPTLEVVQELVGRGNEVWYYSFDSMKDKIEATGAKYISCDSYDLQMDFQPEDTERMVRDIALSTEVIVNATLAMEEAVFSQMALWKPDCIVADSMAIWGKLAAQKLGIPFVSSTTTFAFNRYSSKIMKTGLLELLGLLRSMPKANKQIRRLQEKGYPVKNVLSILQNDNDTETIVYTSPEFQPCAETFSTKYTFVGPSIRRLSHPVEKPDKRTVYISLGTVNTQNTAFFQNCISAFRNSGRNVVISVGNRIDIAALGTVPENIQIERTVNQIEVLQQAELFITHCGMNSVNEALYYQVPLILFPQTSEQRGVANRVSQLGAGLFLRENSTAAIVEAVKALSENPVYRENARKIAEGFWNCKGPKLAADKIIAAVQSYIR